MSTPRRQNDEVKSVRERRLRSDAIRAALRCGADAPGLFSLSGWGNCAAVRGAMAHSGSAGVALHGWDPSLRSGGRRGWRVVPTLRGRREGWDTRNCDGNGDGKYNGHGVW